MLPGTCHGPCPALWREGVQAQTEMHMQGGHSPLPRAQGELLQPGRVTPLQRHIAEASSTALACSTLSCTHRMGSRSELSPTQSKHSWAR